MTRAKMLRARDRRRTLRMIAEVERLLGMPVVSWQRGALRRGSTLSFAVHDEIERAHHD